MNRFVWGIFILALLASLLIGVSIGAFFGGARIIYSERIINNTEVMHIFTNISKCDEPFQEAANKIKRIEADYNSAQRFKDMINK